MTSLGRQSSILLGAALIVAAGCERVKSSNPLSPNVAGPQAGVTVQAPVPVSPANNFTIRDNEQPIVMIIHNPNSNSERPLVMRLQIAIDSGFSTVILNREGLNPAGGGETRFVMSDRLPHGRDYYWRLRADDGANVSDWSGTAQFKVLSPVILGVPEPVFPVANERVGSGTPELKVSNGSATGPVGHITYQFNVSDSQTFSTIFSNAEISQDPGGQTAWTMPQLPAPDRQFFWRVRMYSFDTVGPWSRVEVFRSPVAPPPPPGPGPGPGPGPIPTDWQSCSVHVNNGEELVRCVHSVIQPGPSSTRAFEVTKRVAWLLRDQGGGLLIKNGGENIISWQGYSFAIGRICFPGGHIFKILTDVGDGGTNGPGWHDEGFVEADRYVPAINPGG
jgi:hypothetical protein